jgi:hypothetical protein
MAAAAVAAECGVGRGVAEGGGEGYYSDGKFRMNATSSWKKRQLGYLSFA